MTVTQERTFAATGDAREVTLALNGMTCGACAARIERRLNELDGVSARVNYATERATVRLGSLPVDRVLAEVAAAGYSAEVVADEPAMGAPQPTDLDRRVRSLGRRLAVAGVLFMPLCDVSIAFWLEPTLRFPGWQWLALGLAAPVVLWAAWPFYVAALRAARHGTTTMDTLVSIGIVASTVWSVYAMFWQDTGHRALPIASMLLHGSTGAIYLDVAAGVTTFLLAGRYFEASSKRRAGNALRALAAVGAKEVSVLDTHGLERRRPVSALAVGDRFVVRPGETVAADGEVVFGRSTINRSAMTGESVPVDVGRGNQVTGGTLSVGGRLIVRARRVGSDTQLAQMVRLVERAQNEKAGAQRLADRLAAIFVPIVLVVALLTLVGWLLAGGGGGQACSAALSVLIIACPCALGLATPAALVAATGQGARRGIFFKSYGALEASRAIDTVVLDKTGTLTTGQMQVAEVVAAPGVDAAALLGWAGALEQASEHPIGQAIAAHARATVGRLAAVHDFVAISGHGVRGRVGGHEVTVGAFAGQTVSHALPLDLVAPLNAWAGQGATVVVVRRDGVAVGGLCITDMLRPTAKAAVDELRALGLRCVLLSGDSPITARTVASALGITEVVAAALPADKVEVVQRLQRTGHTVAMVGDGVNDGPALVAADLGLAVGSGTDVAINAADLLIVRDDLRVVPAAVELARRTLRTIRGNLAWAFCYNVVAIPLAACGLLNPLIAAVAMALSSGFVVWNSARLGRMRRGERGRPL